MDTVDRRVDELTREFFAIFPDYSLCRTLAANTLDGLTSRRQAIGHLSSKAWTQEKNQAQIDEKLDGRTVQARTGRIRIRDLSLRQILDLPDEGLEEVVRFYLKHPYAHGRTLRTRWLPNWIRGFFLRALVGNAKSRGLELSYGECFDLLTLL